MDFGCGPGPDVGRREVNSDSKATPPTPFLSSLSHHPTYHQRRTSINLRTLSPHSCIFCQILPDRYKHPNTPASWVPTGSRFSLSAASSLSPTKTNTSQSAFHKWLYMYSSFVNAFRSERPPKLQPFRISRGPRSSPHHLTNR